MNHELEKSGDNLCMFLIEDLRHEDIIWVSFATPIG